MTVNVGLITSGALVFGCDSVASTVQPLLDPFGRLETDEDGNLVQDEDGKLTAKFEWQDLRRVVISAWGGVTKMFQIHPHPSPVVAVTAGTAVLLERSIASHAEDFFRTHKAYWSNPAHPKRLVNVEPICNAFLAFMRLRYDEHYDGSPIPEGLRTGPEFLVGGIGRDDTFPSLYRVSVQENSIESDFPEGEFGISWNGQADAIERFIRGYDLLARMHVEAEVRGALERHAEDVHSYVTNVVNEILEKLGKELPSDTEINVPPIEEVRLNWELPRLPIDYRNLPLQEAVNFASAMVMIQASRDRFSEGVATVGGRTHIGVITKANGFELLNEPELVHRLTGLSDEA